jgi:hypothetical protein
MPAGAGKTGDFTATVKPGHEDRIQGGPRWPGRKQQGYARGAVFDYQMTGGRRAVAR